MDRITITPDNEQHWLDLRTQDLTSTDVAALFGVSPYSTLFEVWHRKRNGTGSTLSDNERMRWGRRLEATIAQGIAEDKGWTCSPFKDYMRIPQFRLGASFDFIGWEKGVVGHGIRGMGHILEIKNVDSLVFKQTWTEDGDSFEAPPHIELQVQHQLLVSGLKVAYIGALVGGNRVVLIRREAQADIQNAILREALKFWASVEAGQEPAPDFERDAAFIASLYQHAEPGKVLDAQGDEETARLVMAYQQASHEVKVAEEAKKAAKAALLVRIGDAEKVKGEGWTISAGVQGPVEVPAHTREGFRNFRITFKKSAAQAA